MPGLDGIRAFSVAAVVWHHTHVGLPALPMTHNGFLGVDVFFVLSGFLITTLLLAEKARTGRISLRHFYARRSLRIFPLYYVVLLGMTAYSLLAGARSSQSALFLHELPFHLTYTSNWLDTKSIMAITWSLSTEEQFYLLWPPLLVWLGASSVRILMALLVLSQAINFGWLDGVLAGVGMPYGSLPILQCTLTPIILGVLLSISLSSSSGRARIERVAGSSWALVLCLALMLLAANVPGDMRGWPRLVFQLATAGFLAAVVMQPGHVIVRLLEWRALVFVGAVSYGVYLLHMLVADVVTRALGKAGWPSEDLRFVFTLVATIGVAGLSFRFFEQPILRLKDRFR
ncbi:MAG: acyltransferase [Rhizobacter sp.]|nr:acyltransferase [Rhizobacter sp.]